MRSSVLERKGSCRRMEREYAVLVRRAAHNRLRVLVIGQTLGAHGWCCHVYLSVLFRSSIRIF